MIDAIAARYVAVGAVNTAVGFGSILGLQEVLGLSPSLANAGGYAIGLTFSYFLNKGFAFKSNRSHVSAVPLFFAVAGVCYLLNLIVLHTSLYLIDWPAAASQALAVASYTAAFYLLNRHVVFPEPFR